MSRGAVRRVVCLAVSLAWASAWAYEGEVHRQEVDAGVHVPVLTKAPELLEFVQAPYPAEAEKEGLFGAVKMNVTLAADGTVAEVQVTQPLGHGFDEAAVEAVRQFRFSPAEVDGVPAPITLEYVYHFELKEEAPEPPPPEAKPTATLAGEVVARGSRTRVPGAMVRCGDLANAPEATSDAEGKFTLVVEAGECQLKAVANGFELYETKETLEAGQRLEVVYHLVPKAIGYETVVRGAREKKEVVRRTLERQEIQKVPGTFGDPIRVIQNLPGVARAPYISGQLIVRGASASETQTLFDGVEIPLLYHLGGGPSVVNAEFLDRVDFYPGGFSTRYGRAIGGMVDVATRKGARDALHGVAKVDLLDASLFVESPVVEGVSVAAAARRSYIDGLLPLVTPKPPGGGTLLILPRYWDYQVRSDIGTRLGSSGESAQDSFYVMAFGSDDQLKVVATGSGQNRDVQLDFHTLFHRVKGDWTRRKGKVQSVLTPYVGYDLGAGNFGLFKVSVDAYSLGLREDVAVDLSRHVTFRAGADVLFEHLVGKAQLPVLDGTQYVAFPGAEPRAEMQEIRRTINSFDGAAFTETDFKVWRFTFTPGVRYSYSRLHDQPLNTADPRGWIRFQAHPNTQLKTSFGLYSQPPEATDMEPPPFGNPKLTHERAFQTSLGVEQKLTDVVQADVTGYFNRRYDLVVEPGRTFVNEDGSVTQERLSNDGLGRAYGLELMLRHEPTERFFGWVAYTLNRSEFRRRYAPEYTLTGWDQTHILTAVGNVRLLWGFEFGARFRYVTGRPFTPLEHPYDRYDVDANSYSPVRGATLSRRLPSFNQLDLRLDWNHLFKHWTLTIYVDVQNVYNAQNVEASFYDYRFRQKIDVPGIPVLPVLGAKGSF